MKALMRFAKIFATVIRFRLDQLLLPRFLCISAYLYPQGKKRRMRDLPERRLRAALESLGPIFVKFGQVLSTRQDMLPEAFTTELAKLQDSVEPFPTEQATLLWSVSCDALSQIHFETFQRDRWHRRQWRKCIVRFYIAVRKWLLKYYDLKSNMQLSVILP